MTDNDKKPEILTAYLDGELTSDEARKLELRLEAEPELAQELAKLRTVRQAVRSLPREQLGGGFTSGVLEQIERRHLISTDHSTHGRGSIHWSRYLTSAAAVLLIIGLGAAVFVSLYVPDQSDQITIADKTQTETAPPPQPAGKVFELAKKVPAETEKASAPLAMRADKAKLQEPQTLSSFLADQQIAAKDRPEAIIHEVILTDNLPAAKADLQRLLMSYGITHADRDQSANDEERTDNLKSNIYTATPAGPDAVQYVVLLDQHLLPHLRRFIRNLGRHEPINYVGQPIVPYDSISLKREFTAMGAGRSLETAASAPTSQPATQPTNGQLADREPMVTLVISLRRATPATIATSASTSQPATQPATTRPCGADN